HQEVLEGMGDIHLETVIERLKTKFGVTVLTEEARVPYRETVRSASKAQGRHKRQTGGKGQFGDCWIELEPLERGTGFVFESRIVGGSIPKQYIPAIEKGIREAMEHGFQAGYPAVDFKVTVYDGSYHDVDSNEAAFKTAGAIALREAAAKAQPVILEPMVSLDVDIPDECVGDVVGDLNGRRGRLQGMDQVAPGKTRVHATVPMALTGRYALDLRSITKGRGFFKQSVSHYDELPHPEAQKLVQEYAAARAAHEDH
ncbi:MAG TPA: elongation factor G, partial [Fimbriimonadaceae bacterium]|nr:elongation factor G [Fimbriimonadaceae bacterium]